ncbi:MAG: NAD(P)/FAD-dependent oxidoreductase [Actinobacteria bacterium]|nr:NAD(P)/FAD-dependent oxidoreductase [Actinomycetota bacterium]
MDSSGSWDAVVIGAGMGGLTAAAYLAATGSRTLLLEQYAVAGGSSHVFRRKNEWEFEVGLHYLSDCGPDGQIPTMLRGLGLQDRIEFLPMDRAGFDTIVYPDFELRVPVGWDNFLANLIEAFPGEERALRKFVGVVQAIGQATDHSSTPASTRGLLRFVADSGTAARWAVRPISALLEACDLSPRARAVLSAQWISYSCPPSRAPVALHAGFLDEYIGGGAYFPRGGGQMIAAHLVDVIRGHGGEVRTQAGVERILVEAGAVAGVQLESGETVSAPVVVSGTDIKHTYLKMVGREHLRRRTAERVAGYRMAPGFINAYIGLDVDLRGRMPATNIFSCPTWDTPDDVYRGLIASDSARDRDAWLEDFERRAAAFVHSSTVKDPESDRYAPPGCSSVESMFYVPSDHGLWGVSGWDCQDWSYRRSDVYQEIKERLTETMIQRVEDVLPGIEQHVVYREAATPFTQQRYTRTSGGSAYGIEYNTRQSGPARPRSGTEIRGLFLAGASTAWGPGIEGSMLSGVHAAAAVLRRDLAGEIRAGKVLGDSSRLSAGGPGWDPLTASKRLARSAPKAIPAGQL